MRRWRWDGRTGSRDDPERIERAGIRDRDDLTAQVQRVVGVRRGSETDRDAADEDLRAAELVDGARFARALTDVGNGRRHIAGNPETAHIPVILLTARADEEDKVRGLRLGADDYITKPFSALELTTLLTTGTPHWRYSATLMGQIARCEKQTSGSVPLTTLQANVDYGYAVAKTTYGTIGVNSNGYLVAGGGTAEDNNCCNVPGGPSPERPNDVLAPFWTDLDGSDAPGIHPLTALSAILPLRVPDKTKEMVLWDNIARLVED